MEKPLIIQGTEDSPKIILDKERRAFEISGRSLPEDAEKFYLPVLSWIEKYLKSPCPSTEMVINLEYFNSSSVKQLLKILLKLEQISKAGDHVNIIWCYDQDDELMEIKGREIKSILHVPFELRINS